MSKHATEYHDIDPEWLDVGIEEEEEEEEEEEQDDLEEELDDDEGEEDRGDQVDDDLGDDEPEEDEAPEEDDEAPADDAEPEPAPSKSRMVPHARFNEINDALKAERQERLRLEEELARARGQAPAAQPPAAPEAPAAFDFDSAEDRYQEALLEGDSALAKQVRAEIRAEEKRQAIEAAEQRVQQAQEEARRQSAEQQQVQAVQAAAAAMLAKYPQLDANGPDADDDALDQVIALRDGYITRGMSAAEAITQAAERVMARLAPAPEPASRKGDLSREQLERNLERQRRTPPRMPGVGQRNAEIDFANLSEREFDSLSDADKRRARGDFVKG